LSLLNKQGDFGRNSANTIMGHIAVKQRRLPTTSSVSHIRISKKKLNPKEIISNSKFTSPEL